MANKLTPQQEIEEQQKERFHIGTLSYLLAKFNPGNEKENDEFIDKVRKNRKNLELSAKAAIQMCSDLTKDKALPLMTNEEYIQYTNRCVSVGHLTRDPDMRVKLSWIVCLLYNKNGTTDHTEYIASLAKSPHDLEIAAYTAELMCPEIDLPSPLSKAEIYHILDLDNLKTRWEEKEISEH